jgi:hypothetical protein
MKIKRDSLGRAEIVGDLSYNEQTGAWSAPAPMRVPSYSRMRGGHVGASVDPSVQVAQSIFSRKAPPPRRGGGILSFSRVGNAPQESAAGEIAGLAMSVAGVSGPARPEDFSKLVAAIKKSPSAAATVLVKSMTSRPGAIPKL